jgi:hypothetical protein
MLQAATIRVRLRLKECKFRVREIVRRNLCKPAEIVISDLDLMIARPVNHAGWEDGEYKAFLEYAGRTARSFEYVASVRTGGQVAVRLLAPAAARATSAG